MKSNIDLDHTEKNLFSGPANSITEPLTRLVRDQKGVVAPTFAIFLVVFIAFVGAAVDLGLLYTAKSQLQAAADSAALASASELVVDADNDRAPEANYPGAQTLATTYTENNELLGDKLTWLGSDSFEAGLWDPDLGDFASTGPSSNPDDLTATRVKLERDVGTYFIRILGMDQVKVDAASVGYLGCPASVPSGEVDLPIGFLSTELASLQAGDPITWNQDDDVAWSHYIEGDHPDDNTLNDYVDKTKEIGEVHTGPPPYRGDAGFKSNLLGSSCNAGPNCDTDTKCTKASPGSPHYGIYNRWQDEMNASGEWKITVPVVEVGSGDEITVIGFVSYVITNVSCDPTNPRIEGYWDPNDIIVGNSTTGGECYGMRASNAALLK